jgi:glycosyltransferase involved in cell wall biosynthesis
VRIAITVDPTIPVPPDLYGGIERIVDFLVRGLIERGNKVTLFAHPASRTPARLYFYGIPPHCGWRARSGELWQVGSGLWRMRNELDVVHSFGRLAALLPILPYRKVVKIQSYQRDNVPWRSVRIATRLAGKSICFTGCSTSVYRDRANQGELGGDWRTIFNGVDLAKYEFKPVVAPDAPLVFLGRLERIKGVHNAIAIARAAGRKLIIAGNKVETGPDANYFHQEVAPQIDDDRVKYIGPVNDVQKNELLGQSGALLMPIEWEEPFGIVMVESLACGTPIIAFPRGSVPEVVREGVNGFAATNTVEASLKVRRLSEIDRLHVRKDCEVRFSHQVIVSQYEALYFELLGR